jgi:CDP-6-deoxy-D-xylo-4-hexulose-3-dehydrase
VDASLDFWLTTGRYNEAFEVTLAQLLGRKFALTVNSGSSANLLAVAALCSPQLKDRRLRPGDEVITVAAGFPTTVAPLIQHGLVPVFVDVQPPAYNAVPEQVAAAIGPRTKAVFLAHTLGNPFDVAAITALTFKHGLWLLEDSCDALGSAYILDNLRVMCGGFGHMATFSFYPAHHITTGEGGALVTDDRLLHKILLSLRDWGRECWCPPGHDDTCKRRYDWQYAGLPEGYDHKYVYSHLGYNLKFTDMQAAIGLAQLDKLPCFGEARRRNFARLHEQLKPLEGEVLILPAATPASEPSWFGFLITLNQGHNRRPLLEHLNSRKIGTRLLFAGNIIRQPCFENAAYRQVGDLFWTDAIMERSFWVGVYPGLGDGHIDYLAETILKWFRTGR